MEFNWTTFALEILNFLALVWILQRFLYKPVLNAIARRRAAIDKSLEDARVAQTEAAALKQQYESRLANWAGEKDKAHTQLLEEISAERARLLTALQASLELERTRNRVVEERRNLETRRMAEEAARSKGGQFVARLLSRLANDHLESRMLETLLEDLPGLAETDLQALRAAAVDTGYRLQVTSRFPIAGPGRDALTRAFGVLLGKPVACEFAEGPELLAGLRIGLGAWVLHANLHDELRFFAEAADRAG